MDRKMKKSNKEGVRTASELIEIQTECNKLKRDLQVVSITQHICGFILCH